MNKLNPTEIQEQWNLFLSTIDKYISGERGKQLIEFYKNLEDRLIIYPASNVTKYHNCFPGGYIDHVNRVVKCSLGQYKLWKIMGMDTTSFTLEELIFSAINHDLGKIGNETEPAYLPSEDDWRKKNLGEMYTFNTKLNFMTVPDRSIYLLQNAGIKLTQNEFIGIKTHDGLYDQANEAYLKSWSVETKQRSSLPYILHMADMMAARIEFENEWLKEGQLKK
jgi:hypothetical protein